MIEHILFIGMPIVAMMGGYAMGYMDGSKNERRECNLRIMRAYEAGVKEGRNMQ